MTAMLEVRDLEVAYGKIVAVKRISFSVEQGQVVSLIGTNGAGKTTTLRTISGLLRPSSGEILFQGERIDHVAAHDIVARGLAHSPEGRRIFPKLSVEENLRVGLQARADGRRSVPEDVYQLFPVLKTMGKRMGGDLSGGQQQQLAIARALVGDPKVLLLDEPTEGIQPNIIQQIGAVLRKLVEERAMTVVLVEQYLDFVREFGHGFYVMNRGRVVAEGPTAELSADVVHQHLSV
jgi:urea ABC transporter ATP-binding protein UrtE